MVKYLLKVTTLVSDRKFGPRPYVSKPSLLSPYAMLALLLKKNIKMMKKMEKEKEEKEEEGEWKGVEDWTRAHDTCVYLREPNGTFECCLSVSVQWRLN